MRFSDFRKDHERVHELRLVVKQFYNYDSAKSMKPKTLYYYAMDYYANGEKKCLFIVGTNHQLDLPVIENAHSMGTLSIN